MTLDVVETGLPNLQRSLAVIRIMIRLIVVANLIIAEIPDITATVLDQWIIAIIQPELGVKTTSVVLVISRHQVWQQFVTLTAIDLVVPNMADVVEKTNIAEMVPISEKSQNLQKHEEKMVFVVMDVEANPTQQKTGKRLYARLRNVVQCLIFVEKDPTTVGMEQTSLQCRLESQKNFALNEPTKTNPKNHQKNIQL